MDPAAEALRDKFRALQPLLDERTRRLWAAVEARALGRGGISAVALATGMSRTTVRAGLRELADDGTVAPSAGVRRSGGGRKALADRDPALVDALQRKLEPVARGDSRCALRWTCRSAAHLAAELCAEGHPVSGRSVNRLLHGLGYSLRASGKTLDGGQCSDRDAQFRHINRRVAEFHAEFQPVVSVEVKKKELSGTFRDSGPEWRLEVDPEPVRVRDCTDSEPATATPCGWHDVTANRDWVSVGVDRATMEFAVESLRRWWRSMGRAAFPAARRLLVMANGGVSNSGRGRLWKIELQKLADDLGLHIAVSHFPPGTSKWSEIQHRMISRVTQDERGCPPVSWEVGLSLIGAVTTEGDSEIHAEPDEDGHVTEREVADDQLARLDIDREEFHGEWNYTLNPRSRSG